MNMILVKALAAFVPVCVLFGGSVVLLFRVKSAWCVLQVVGAGSLVVVILAHLCEALRILPWSPGHYIDLSGAAVGVTLFPIGYLLHAMTKRGSL